MSYEAVAFLYSECGQDTFGQRLSLIATCSRRSVIRDDSKPLGYVHKVDISAMPDISCAKIEVTHEVSPGLKAASQITTVNEKLKAIGFDSGAVVALSNFGPGKTFNCDVRGRLEHHSGQISCLASNSSGSQLASGCTSGTITLYQTRETDIAFLSKTNETRADYITGLSYFKPEQALSFGDGKKTKPLDDALLIYSSTSGHVGLLDTRCNLANGIHSELVFLTDPTISITSLAHSSSKPNYIYLGGLSGDILTCDLRARGKCLLRKKLEEDHCISKLKEVCLPGGEVDLPYLAYTNGSDRLRMLNIETMTCEDDLLKCDRKPTEKIRDFVQVDDKLVTCGDNTSIGCWTFHRKGAQIF